MARLARAPPRQDVGQRQGRRGVGRQDRQAGQQRSRGLGWCGPERQVPGKRPGDSACVSHRPSAPQALLTQPRSTRQTLPSTGSGCSDAHARAWPTCSWPPASRVSGALPAMGPKSYSTHGSARLRGPPRGPPGYLPKEAAGRTTATSSISTRPPSSRRRPWKAAGPRSARSRRTRGRPTR
jgi:hypothetical protein